jgi:hypothetical protein
VRLIEADLFSCAIREGSVVHHVTTPLVWPFVYVYVYFVPRELFVSALLSQDEIENS